MPSYITQNTDVGLSTAEITWSEPTASDNSGSVTLTSSHSPGSNFSIGVTVVTYTAIDDSSNTVNSTFSITIQGMNLYESNLFQNLTYHTTGWLKNRSQFWWPF